MGKRRAAQCPTSAPAGEVVCHAPPGLSAATLQVDGEVFAVFEWAAERPARIAGLTQAERDVLDRLLGGTSNAGIASARGSSVRTVANQVASLLRKLAAGSRFELIQRFGARDGAPR